MRFEPFDFDPRTRVVFGPGVFSRLGELVQEYGGERVLLVTDSGLREAGHVERAVSLIRQSGVHCDVFDDVHPNPTTDDIDRVVACARPLNINMIVALGGGSCLDCAKGLNFLLTNGGRMRDYQGVGKARSPMLPLIAVPTTSGTGSEAQSFAVIADATTHMKMACGDKKAAPRVALLDPVLTVTMPHSVTAVTGVDAISHAVETFVTRTRTPVSQLLSRQAWRLLSQPFLKVLGQPDDLVARGQMQVGAHLAGAAIENSMLGAAHALANPLSARFDVIHGVAVGVMLPWVMEFNARNPEIQRLYAILAQDAGLCAANDPEAAARLQEFIRQLISHAQQPQSLEECGVDPAQMSEMAEEAAAQWTAQFNPRPVTESELLELYQCAFHAPRK